MEGLLADRMTDKQAAELSVFSERQIQLMKAKEVPLLSCVPWNK